MKTTLGCPLVSLFKAVAKLKKLQDEGFIHFGPSLWVSVDPMVVKSSLGTHILLPRIGSLLDHLQGAHVFIRIDLQLASIGSSILTIPRTSWHWWHMKEILYIYSWLGLRKPQCYTKRGINLKDIFTKLVLSLLHHLGLYLIKITTWKCITTLGDYMF